MFTGIRFHANEREFLPILDVVGEMILENPEMDSTQQLLIAASILIKKAQGFNAVCFDQVNPPVSRYKCVYFTLIFPTIKDMRNFAQKFFN